MFSNLPKVNFSLKVPNPFILKSQTLNYNIVIYFNQEILCFILDEPHHEFVISYNNVGMTK